MTQTLYSKQQIQTRIKELAKQIASDYKNQPLLLVSILKGSFIFSADMIRALYEQGLTDITVDFMQVSSYGSSRTSSKDPKIISDITTPLQDKHVLIIDDILDTGYTASFVKEHFQTQHPASMKLLVLLDKAEKRAVPLQAEYVGFILQGSPWVEGYGLDTDEQGRARPEIIEK